MEKYNKWLIPVSAALVAIMFIFMLASNSGSVDVFGGQSRISGMHILDDGLKVDGATQLDGAVTIDGALTANGALTTSAITYSHTSVSTTTTLTSANFGETILIDDADGGSTITLPAATSGAEIRFVVVTAFTTADHVIDSAEGDNIHGSLIVNGAVVACSGEDQINFANASETVGDFVTLYSDGTDWFIGPSTAGAAGGITCTDPA